MKLYSTLLKISLILFCLCLIRSFSRNVVLREILAILGQQLEQMNELLKRTDVLNATIDFVVVCISGLTLSSAGNVVLGDPALPVAF